MPPTILFDGECVLCSRVVQFVLKHERDPSIHFAATQSEAGQALAARHGISAAELETSFVLLEDGAASSRSEAALRLARYLRAPWRWAGLLGLVPRPVRNAAYSAIARRRYKLFGKLESCFIPEPGSRHRFLLDRRSSTPTSIPAPTPAPLTDSRRG